MNADDTVSVKVRVDVRCSPGVDHEYEIIQVRIAIAICIGTFGGAFVTDGVGVVDMSDPAYALGIDGDRRQSVGMCLPGERELLVSRVEIVLVVDSRFDQDGVAIDRVWIIDGILDLVEVVRNSNRTGTCDRTYRSDDADRQQGP